MAIRTSWTRMALGSALGIGAALTLFLGRGFISPRLTAAPPAEPTSDYGSRVVAYIYGTMPITREEFGEYLIARQTDKLDLLVNKRIIEHACKQKGIEVTAAEVEAAFMSDIAGINVKRKEFVDQVLKQYGKSEYEWREDVIKPRLLMDRLCRDRVHVTDEDLQKKFETLYGEKVECRIILWPKGQEKYAHEMWAKLRESEEAFDRAARQQANPQLAQTGGRIAPISRHTGHENLEKAAFSLRPGDLSELIGTPEGTIVLKCVSRIPPNDKVKLEGDVRKEIEKIVIDEKVQKEIPEVFKELKKQANPTLILKPGPLKQEDLMREVEKEIKADDKKITGRNAPPQGN